MRLLYNGEVVATITTNRSLTIEEALYAYGYDINELEDLKKANDDGFKAAYIDDDGNYQIDLDNLEMEY